MAEIRQNPITKDWVIIASERTKRPDDYRYPWRIIKTGRKRHGIYPDGLN